MRRQQHDKVAAPNIIPCPNCGEPVVPHRACAACGHYKGRAVKRVATTSGE
jgi:large subunit ribosomal protein L32